MMEAEEGSTVYVSAYGRVERIVLEKVSLSALHCGIAKCFELTANVRVQVEEDGQELQSDAQVFDAVKRSQSLRVMPGDNALADIEQKMWHLRQMQLGFFQDELLQLKHVQTSAKDEAQRLRSALEQQSQMLGELAKELRAERRAREEAEQYLRKQQDEIREELRADHRAHETWEATLRKEMQEVRQEVLRVSAASERDVSDLQKAVGKEAKTRGKTVDALLSEWATWASSHQELQAQLVEVKALAERRITDEKADVLLADKNSESISLKQFESIGCQEAIGKAVKEHVHVQLEVNTKAVSERLNEKLDAVMQDLHEEVRMAATDAAEAVCRAEEAAIDAAAARRAVDCLASDEEIDQWRGQRFSSGQLSLASSHSPSAQPACALDAYRSLAPPVVMGSASCVAPGRGRSQPLGDVRNPSPPPHVPPAQPSPHSLMPAQPAAFDSTVSAPVPALPLCPANQGGRLLAPAHAAQLPHRKSLDPRLLPSQQGLPVAGKGGA